MKARCLSYSGDRATVVLEPSWIGQMLGARASSVDLVCRRDRDPDFMWIAVASGRRLADLPHGDAIRDALDFREVGTPSRWALTSGEEAVLP